MKSAQFIVITTAIVLALAPPLHAEFLVVRIRESTAENISQWIAAFCVALAALTLRRSCKKEGRGK